MCCIEIRQAKLRYNSDACIENARFQYTSFQRIFYECRTLRSDVLLGATYSPILNGNAGKETFIRKVISRQHRHVCDSDLVGPHFAVDQNWQ